LSEQQFAQLAGVAVGAVRLEQPLQRAAGAPLGERPPAVRAVHDQEAIGDGNDGQTRDIE
jgi:hypothetical protein